MLQALPLEAELKTLSLSADQTLCAVGGRGLLGVCKIIGRVPVAQQQSQIFNSYIQSAKELEVFAAAIDAGFDGGRLGLEEYRILYSRTKNKKNLSLTCNCVSFHPRLNNILATGATNGAVVFWDVEQKRRVNGKRAGKGRLPPAVEHVSKSHEACVNSICWHPAGDPPYLLSASMDKTVALWDRRDPEEPQHAFPCRAKVHCVSFNPSSPNEFAAGCGDGSIQIWDIRQARQVKRIMAHTRHVNSIHWHPERMNILASGGSDKAIRIWDTSGSGGTGANTVSPSTSLGSSSSAGARDSSRRSNRKIGGGAQQFIELQALASVSQVKWRPRHPTQIASTCVEVDFAISLWDIHSPHVPKQIFRGHTDAVPDITWLPPESEGKEGHLLACSRDETIGLHGFETAYNPSENATRNGISISPRHDIAMVANNHHILSTSLLNLNVGTKQIKKKRFKYLARHYKSKLGRGLNTFSDICENNRKACMVVNLPTLAQTWGVLAVLLREEIRQSGSEARANEKLASEHGNKGSMKQRAGYNTSHYLKARNVNISTKHGKKDRKNTVAKTVRNYGVGHGRKNRQTRGRMLADYTRQIRLTSKQISFGVTSTENDTTDDDRLYISDLQSGLDDIGTDDEDDDGNSTSLHSSSLNHNEFSVLPASPSSRHMYGGSASNPPESTIADFQDAKSATDNSFMGSDFDDEDEYAAEEDADGTFSMLLQQLDMANPTGAAFTQENGSGGNNNITGAPEGKNNLHLGLVRKNMIDKYNRGLEGDQSGMVASNIARARRPPPSTAFGAHKFDNKGAGGLDEDYPYESKRHNNRNARAGVVGMDSYESKRMAAPTELLVSLNAIRGRNGQDQLKILPREGQKKYRSADLGNSNMGKMPTEDMSMVSPYRHPKYSTYSAYNSNDGNGSLTLLLRAETIRSLLDYYSDVESNLQFCAILADLAINAGIDIDRSRAETWFHAYVEILHKHNLVVVATNFMKGMKGSVGKLNQASTTIYSYCNSCTRPLQASWNSICDKCVGKNVARCAICEQRVRGQFMWCQQCGHGGHLDHMSKWFETNVECPTGCGCKCNISLCNK